MSSDHQSEAVHVGQSVISQAQRAAAAIAIRQVADDFCDEWDHLHEARAIAHWLDRRADDYERDDQ